MSTIDLLGAAQEEFIKSSLDVYVDLAAGTRYIGKTTPEKTVRFPRDYMKFSDGVPSSDYVIDFFSVGLEIDFTYKQPSADLMALMLTGDLDKSSGTYDWVFLGSNPGQLDQRTWRFVGETRDERLFELVIRQGIIMNPGDMTFGTQDYAGQQITVVATQDDSITNQKRNLAYFRIAPRTFS